MKKEKKREKGKKSRGLKISQNRKKSKKNKIGHKKLRNKSHFRFRNSIFNFRFIHKRWRNAHERENSEMA